MSNLEKAGVIPILKERIAHGVPFLGICLGLQLLFTESEEKINGLNVNALFSFFAKLRIRPEKRCFTE